MEQPLPQICTRKGKSLKKKKQVIYQMFYRNMSVFEA